MKQLLALIFFGTVIQIVLGYFLGLSSQLCYVFGFLIGITYQGLCDLKRRSRVRDEMLSIMKQVQPRSKPKLSVVKKDK